MGSVTNPDAWREITLRSAQDLRRGIDYLETRSDVDASHVAFYGLSLGAALGPIMTAVEPRFRASILLGAGLYSWRMVPDADPLNFLAHVKTPTLMINGRHDYFFPVETSQAPMFDLIGTHDKRHLLFESGHLVSERESVRTVHLGVARPLPWSRAAVNAVTGGCPWASGSRRGVGHNRTGRVGPCSNRCGCRSVATERRSRASCGR